MLGGALGITGTLNTGAVDLECDLACSSGTGVWNVADYQPAAGGQLSVTGGDLTINTPSYTFNEICVSGGSLTLTGGGVVQSLVVSGGTFNADQYLQAKTFAATGGEVNLNGLYVGVSGDSDPGSFVSSGGAVNIGDFYVLRTGSVSLSGDGDFGYIGGDAGSLAIAAGTINVGQLSGSWSQIDIEGGNVAVNQTNEPFATAFTVGAGQLTLGGGIAATTCVLSGGTMSLSGSIVATNCTLSGTTIFGSNGLIPCGRRDDHRYARRGGSGDRRLDRVLQRRHGMVDEQRRCLHLAG